MSNPITSKGFRRIEHRCTIHYRNAIYAAVHGREQLLEELQTFVDTIGVGHPDIGDRLQQLIDKHK